MQPSVRQGQPLSRKAGEVPSVARRRGPAALCTIHRLEQTPLRSAAPATSPANTGEGSSEHTHEPREPSADPKHQTAAHKVPHSPRDLALIYARSEDHCIGKDGRIPWRLPDDFAHFKRTTLGHPIIMGRRTYEDHDSALPGRLNLVVTRNPGYQPAPGVVVCPSLDDAYARAFAEHDHAFVIGGVGLFAAALPDARTVYETIVHARVQGDATLPAFDFTGWTTATLQHHPADARHAHAFTVYRHDRP